LCFAVGASPSDDKDTLDIPGKMVLLFVGGVCCLPFGPPFPHHGSRGGGKKIAYDGTSLGALDGSEELDGDRNGGGDYIRDISLNVCNNSFTVWPRSTLRMVVAAHQLGHDQKDYGQSFEWRKVADQA